MARDYTARLHVIIAGRVARRSPSTRSETSPKASRRSASRASAPFRTFPRRTTGTAATRRSTSGSRSASRGLDVVDMACGEGYGSAVLARRAARVTGVDANPEATSTRAPSTRAPACAFARDLVQTWAEPVDAVVFLQTIEHVEDPGAILDALQARSCRPGGVAYVSTPNVLTLAGPDREKSDNPWHVKEYRADEFRELCEAHFDRVEMLGLFHARKLRAARVGDRERALGRRPRAARHHRSRSTTGSSRRSPRATSRCRPAPLDRALDFLAILR